MRVRRLLLALFLPLKSQRAILYPKSPNLALAVRPVEMDIERDMAFAKNVRSETLTACPSSNQLWLAIYQQLEQSDRNIY